MGEKLQEIKDAEKQKVDTRGEQIQRVADAINANPDKNRLYAPNFKYSKQYEELAKKDTSTMSNREKLKHSQALTKIQIGGTITDEEKQAIIDKALDMPIASVIAEMKKYESKVMDLESKLENFDTSEIQRKADTLTAEYKKKADARKGNWGALASLQDEYEVKVRELELDGLIKPMNDLKIQRYEALIYKRAYEYVVRAYISENQELIEAERVEARKREVRGSLTDLVEYIEEA